MTRALVLLAAYNGAECIEEQVQSILAQQGVELKVVVGDDASFDGTRELLSARWGADARVSVIAWQKSSGSAGANFRRLICAVDASCFDVVALADQDDVWWPGKLRAGATALLDAKAAGYSCAVNALWPNGRAVLLTQNPHQRRADFLFEGAGQGCTFVLERGFFQRVQQFLTTEAGNSTKLHFHDWMLYLLCRAWGEPWIFDVRPQMDYRQHAGNDIGARSGGHGLRRRLRLIRKGWYATQVAEACSIYEAAGGADEIALRLIADLHQRETRSLGTSLRLSVRLLHHGRRRFTDRAVLFISALLGWI